MNDDNEVPDGMDGVRRHLKALIRKLIDDGRIDSLQDWCQRAGFQNAAIIEHFLAGRTRSLRLIAFMDLANALGLKVQQVVGPISREDLLDLVRDFLAEASPREAALFTADIHRLAAEEQEATAAALSNPPAPSLEYRRRIHRPGARKRIRRPKITPEE